MDTKKKVLIVEDDELMRTTLTKRFEEEGFAVKAAEDGEQGLAAWKESRPDAIVLDVMLPGKSGLETLEEIRIDAGNQSVPAFMLTNTEDMDYVSRAVAGGAIAYIKKSNEGIDRVVDMVKEKLGVT